MFKFIKALFKSKEIPAPEIKPTVIEHCVKEEKEPTSLKAEALPKPRVTTIANTKSRLQVVTPILPSIVTSDEFDSLINKYMDITKKTLHFCSTKGGMSMGLGAWSLESGKLQEYIFTPVIQKIYEPAFNDCFPRALDHLQYLTGEEAIQAVAFTKKDYNNFIPLWKTEIEGFLKKSVIEEIQLQTLKDLAEKSKRELKTRNNTITPESLFFVFTHLLEGKVVPELIQTKDLEDISLKLTNQKGRPRSKLRS